MSSTARNPLFKRLRVAVPMLVATGALAAACSSSSGGSAPATVAPAGSAPAASSSASTTATIETHSGPLGTYLTDSAGKTLYLWKADTGTTSNCAGQCATAWPPLTVAAGTTPTASGGATATVGTITRADGKTQVTYAGHPLYYFVADSSAGDTKGQGSDGFGAKWWVVSPAGAAITAAAPAAPATSSGGSAGGGWS